MFGTNRQFNLERFSFSIEGAFLSIFEETGDNQLYFSIARSNTGMVEERNLIKLVPVFEDRELPYIYEAGVGLLKLSTPKGHVEFTYEGPEIIRIRTAGIKLRLYRNPNLHEGGAPRKGGQFEISFNLLGRLLFVPLSGTLTNTASWNFREVRPNPYYIEIEGEAAVHEYYSNTVAKDVYAPFDDCVKKVEADFEKFFKNYPDVPIQYRDMARKAAWLIWSFRLGPRGSLKHTVIYMHKLFMNRAFGWHHCFHAMAMKNNPREAWNMLLTMFDYTDEAGAMADNVDDLKQFVWSSSKPPIHGWALDYIFKNFDLSSLKKEDYEELYGKLSKYAAWWLNHHDHAGKGVPSYYHPDESGYDEATLFYKGLPVQSPDLIANLALLCEGCGKLAAKCGNTGEAETWQRKSEKLIKFLVDDMWDGEQFTAILTATGEKYRCGSIALLQPIILGDRLPKTITAAIARRLTDSREFLTEIGAASEHLGSDKQRLFGFTTGPVVAPTQMLLVMGLWDSGHKDEAQLIAARYLNALLGRGFALGIHNYRREPVTWNLLSEGPQIPPAMAVSFPMSAWVASIFILMINAIMDRS
ncbi:MAG: hypothetical protein LBG07_10880 [Treponema sp.]|jgi:hypothetical protein|nr:hypothetical protein [Treponema sp.]